MTHELRIYGIRHHGPGSARSLVAALAEFQPDRILIEGPPEGDALLALVADADLKPPVALLVYDPEAAGRAVFYPFAEFSPEWQAARFAAGQGIPMRFCDAPVAAMAEFAKAAPKASVEPEEEASGQGPDPQEPEEPTEASGQGPDPQEPEEPTEASGQGPDPQEPEEPTEASGQGPDPRQLRSDPLRALAQAAGYEDTERFWEVLVEQRQDATELFAAINELMTAAREADPASTLPRDLMREAHMRTQIRAEIKAGAERIAVVCGAWHAPALDPTAFTIKADAELTRGVPRIKLASSWVPWSYDRLHRASGYGAGVDSPAWYGCLWHTRARAIDHFVVRAARCFRSAGIEIGPAHAIEAARLAHALAALRELPEPGLSELMQALQTVYGDGDGRGLALVQQQLVVGVEQGMVPDSVPTVPLLADLNRQARRLKLKQEASERVLELDLREDTARERSALLHRLALLAVPWGRLQSVASGARGTFKEPWRLRWDPEFVVALIDHARDGNTIEAAAANVLGERARSETALAKLAALLQESLRADLTAALPTMLARFDALAAATGDVPTLMQSLPPLVELSRYGDVRGTDVRAAARVQEHLAERIAIGLPTAASAIDDAAAVSLREALDACDAALARAGGAASDWCAALAKLADNNSAHALIAGRATRLLLDRGVFSSDEVARRLGLALSSAVAVGQAMWIEGLLGGSGLVLIHQPNLLALIDSWLAGLDQTRFSESLPLLRRAFADFSFPERRQIGERIKAGVVVVPANQPRTDLDPARVALVLPTLRRLLGVEASAQ